MKLLPAIITAVGVGKATPIPSYISAKIGTTLTNIKTITVIATVNITIGYINAPLIFFLTFSLFSKESTNLSKNTSNLPLASPALIRLMYILSNIFGYFSKHFDRVIPPSKLFLISSTMIFNSGCSNWSLNIDKTLRIGRPAFTIVANCFEKITTSSGFIFFLNKLKLEPFFFVLSAAFFLVLISFVMIIFCSFSLKEASSWLKASIDPSTYFPAEIPLYEYVSDDINNYSIDNTRSNSLKFKSPDKIISLPISPIVLKPSFWAIALSSGVVAFAKIASLIGLVTFRTS